MLIKFNPQISQTVNSIEKVGNNLTIDGDLLDIDSIPIGSTVPSEATDSEIIYGIIKDSNGYVTVTVLWRYIDSNDWIGSWPADLIDPPDGVIAPIESTKPEPPPEPEVPPGETP